MECKKSWLNLSKEQRQAFFESVGSEIEKLTNEGIEIVGFAKNDKNTAHRSDHRYLAVWKMPTPDHVKMLGDSVAQSGWYKYFEQVNAGGEVIPPPVALKAMANL